VGTVAGGTAAAELQTYEKLMNDRRSANKFLGNEKAIGR
jgi:hypothetical protein